LIHRKGGNAFWWATSLIETMSPLRGFATLLCETVGSAIYDIYYLRMPTCLH